MVPLVYILVGVALLGDEALGWDVRLVAKPLVEVFPSRETNCIGGDEALDGLELASEAVYGGEVLPGGDEHPWLGIVEDVRPLTHRQPVVEGNHNNTRLRGSEVDEDVLDAVLGEDRYSIAYPEAGGDERIG